MVWLPDIICSHQLVLLPFYLTPATLAFLVFLDHSIPFTASSQHLCSGFFYSFPLANPSSPFYLSLLRCHLLFEACVFTLSALPPSYPQCCHFLRYNMSNYFIFCLLPFFLVGCSTREQKYLVFSPIHYKLLEQNPPHSRFSINICQLHWITE